MKTTISPEAIDADIKALEAEILDMLAEVTV